MTRRPPISAPGLNIRQRRRADGWRVWWEPSPAARAKGFGPVELDADRPTWSVRQAERLTAEARAAETAPAQRRTIAALIDRYTASSKFEALRAATREDYAKAFRILSAEIGDQLVARISKAGVHAFYEGKRRTAGPAQATGLVRRLSLLMAHAELIGWRDDNSNPCARLGLETPAPRDRLASWAEVSALLQASLRTGTAGRPLISIGCAIAMAIYTAQRQTDIIGALRQDLADDHWRLVRSKRGTASVLTIPTHLAPWIRAAARRSQPSGHPQLLVYEGTGAPFLPDTFRTAFRAVRTAAATDCPTVASLQFRDLRRTASAMARAGGADPLAAADMLGNTSDRNPRLSVTYMPPSAAAAARAIDAIQPPPFAQVSPE